MKKLKTKIITLICVCVFILIVFLVIDNILGKKYLVEIKYDQLIQKIDNHEDFVLVISQTTCSHCADYKPKIAKVAKKYKLEMYYIEVNLLDEEERNEFKKYFNYSGTPQTIFVVDGYEKTAANRINGDTSTDKIISKLKSNGFIK